jgi:hypothetical protein
MGGKSRSPGGNVLSQDEAVAAANQNIQHAFFGAPEASYPQDATPAAAAAPEAAPAPEPEAPPAPSPTPESTPGDDITPISPGHEITGSLSTTQDAPTGNVLAQTITDPTTFSDPLKTKTPSDSSTLTGQV